MAIVSEKSRLIKIISILGAFSLFLSAIEYSIPKPFPFLRIGLANLPVIIGLKLLPPYYFALLILVKIVSQALITGTLISYVILLSIASGLGSGIVMFIALKIFNKSMSLVGISVLGALASNFLQLILARFIILGTTAWIIGPPFILTGIITSVILGTIAERFYKTSSWIKKIQQ